MKKFFTLLIAVLLLSSCTAEVYSKSMIGYFDTVVTLTAPADTEQEFDLLFDRVEELAKRYHRMFDAYNEYDGIANIATLNRIAHENPVEVDDELFSLIVTAKTMYEQTDGRVNIALGAVTALWRDAREVEELPNEEQLFLAAEHCNIEDVMLDEEKNTIYFTDPELRLDVGGIAKGYAAEQITEILLLEGYDDLLLSMGGNIVSLGDKNAEGWTAGIENPDPNNPEILEKIDVSGGYSLVVSGDYLRNFTVDGISYGHIIDPTTLYPPSYYASVAVIAESSSTADALSTALFTIPPESALDMAEGWGAGEIAVMLIGKDGEIVKSSNFNDFVSK